MHHKILPGLAIAGALLFAVACSETTTETIDMPASPTPAETASDAPVTATLPQVVYYKISPS